MKIKSIAISNCLSFALQQPTVNPNVVFRTSNQGTQHILIGPNGAGKSNFIEIINHCFRKALFQRAILNESFPMSVQRGEYVNPAQLKDTLVISGDATDWNLRNHDGSDSELQQIILSLELNDNDFDNLEFLLSHASPINAALAKYSNVGPLIPGDFIPALKTYSTVVVNVIYSRSTNHLTVTFTSEDDPAVSFIKTYFRNFQVFQMIISLFNRYEREKGDAQWPELQQTFAMLGSYRNYSGINSAINIESNRSFQPFYDRLKTESTRSGGGDEPAVFEMVKRKIGYAFYDLYVQHPLDEAMDALYKQEPLMSINKLLVKYLELRIRVKKLNPIDSTMELHFERSGKRLDTSDLSSGEKGILHFIFTLYGFDLRNGLIVIDEPELHLHPQIQREYQAIINDILLKLNIQFIVATHSPLFVDAATIEHVYRFFKHDGQTRIVSPTIVTSQKSLTKILELTNSAKIFFVNKAILVEGETDEYFLKFLLDYLKANADNPGVPSWQKQISDFEIFNIRGKGAREMWTTFLKGFELKVAFIGDWDNIEEVAVFDLAKYSASYKTSQVVAGVAVQQKGSVDGAALFAAVDNTISAATPQNLQELQKIKDYVVARATNYPKLIEHITNNDATEWGRVVTAIDASYADGVFILRQGELEDYLGLNAKGLDHVIIFCETAFPSWLSDTKYASYKDELYGILKRIFE